jgi:hypothetical protein
MYSLINPKINDNLKYINKYFESSVMELFNRLLHQILSKYHRTCILLHNLIDHHQICNENNINE